MSNNKQQTAVDWYIDELWKLDVKYLNSRYDNQMTTVEYSDCKEQIKKKAKEMEKEQIGYSKEDVIKAGEMGEINYLDTLHIVTYLDEAKQFNETYGGKK
jgi:hypothetical protein